MMMPSFSVFRRFSCAKVLNPGGRWGGGGEAGAPPLGLCPSGPASQRLSRVLEGHSHRHTVAPLLVRAGVGWVWTAPRARPLSSLAGGRAPHAPMTRSSVPQLRSVLGGRWKHSCSQK